MDAYAHVVRGEPIPRPLPTIRIGGLDGTPIPDALGGPFGCMIVRSNLLEVLESESGARLQLVPVRVAGMRVRYTLANVLSHVACIDPKRSRMKRDRKDRRIESVDKLALRPLPTDAPGLFHLAELPIVLLVRDSLRARMQAESATPGKFSAVEDFQLE
jgi:hypothetical protein